MFGELVHEDDRPLPTTFGFNCVTCERSSSRITWSKGEEVKDSVIGVLVVDTTLGDKFLKNISHWIVAVESSPIVNTCISNSACEFDVLFDAPTNPFKSAFGIVPVIRLSCWLLADNEQFLIDS